METLQRTANRGSVSTGYDIDNSLKLEDANTEGMAKNFSGDGDQRTWTYSTWVKRTEITGSDAFHLFGASYTNIQFMTNDLLRVELYDGASTVYADLNRVFRDTSAWYHIVVTLDTTQSTAADRVKIYINGVQDTSFNNSTYANMSQNAQFQIGSATANYQFGYYFVGGGNDRRFCGYVAETHYVNGTALDCTSFGEFDSDSGIWIPKEYTGSHGTKGFYFKFDDSSNLGKDSSSGGVGDFTLTNITAADQATDTPTNNFCTGNNLVRFTNPSGQVVTDGATLMTKGANGYETISGTIYVTRGKWYCEVQSILNSATTAHCSVMPDDSPIIAAGGAISNYAGSQSGDGGVSYYANNGNKYLDGGNSSYGNDWKSGTGLGDIMGIALDMDNGKVYFAKANTWQNSGDPTSGATGTGAIDLPSPTKAYTMACAIYANNNSIAINYGGYTYITISSGASDANGYGTFEYAPPSGYYALCTKNLAEYG